MEKIFEFNPVIYPRLIWITYFPDKYEDIFDDVSVFEKDNTFACCDFVLHKAKNFGGVLIRFRSKADMTTETITHESIHAANAILDYCGVGIGVANDEALAYLAGWIAKCCEEVKQGRIKKHE